MARRPKEVWWWEQKQQWCITIKGVRHKLGPDKEAAQTAFHELMANPEKPVPAEAVVAIIELFLDWTLEEKEKGTYDWYKRYLQSFIDSLESKRMLVAHLKVHHVDAWIKRHKKWGDTSKRGAMTAIARCFNWAEKKGHIETNPIRRKLDKPAAGKRDRVISEKEYQSMLPLLHENIKDLVVTCWETGCRPQEATRVEASYVDVPNGRWVFPVEESKGKKEKRIVYLTDTALEITKRLMKENPDGPIFRSRFGAPWNRFTISSIFGELKEELKVKYRLYDFRHTYCTRGLLKGTDPLTMAKLMGHKDLTMINKIYAHITQDVDFMRKAAIRAAR